MKSMSRGIFNADIVSGVESMTNPSAIFEAIAGTN